MNPRRALAFTLIPLSAVPLAAGVPLVAPSVEKRVQELRGQTTEQAGDRAEPRRPLPDGQRPQESTTEAAGE